MSISLDKKELHWWLASGFYGDLIIDVCKAKLKLEQNDYSEIVFHTGKSYWHPVFNTFYASNPNVFSLLNCFKFTKGMIFDVDQENLPDSVKKSTYNIDMDSLAWGESVPLRGRGNDSIDIRKDVIFKLFPARFSNSAILKKAKENKLAVIQPVSTENKPPDKFKEYYLPKWKKTIESLKNKGYVIVMIGGRYDEETIRHYYPELLVDPDIFNLVNKLNFFESLDLIWNYSDINVSCCSWTAWYSKAAGIKTAMAGGYDMMHDVLAIRTYKYELVGNNSCSIMDYANKKEECDNNIADWIKSL